MNVLGVDQSFTATGLTTFDGKIFSFFLIKTEFDKFKQKSIQYTERILYIKNEIEKIIDLYNIEYAAIEGMSYGSKRSIVFDLGGLSHCIRIVFIQKHVPYIIVPPKVLKKYWTNNGNADKLAMIHKAEERKIDIPYKKKYSKILLYDDNVVDSLALSQFIWDYKQSVLDESFIEKIETN